MGDAMDCTAPHVVPRSGENRYPMVEGPAAEISIHAAATVPFEPTMSSVSASKRLRFEAEMTPPTMPLSPASKGASRGASTGGGDVSGGGASSGGGDESSGGGGASRGGAESTGES